MSDPTACQQECVEREVLAYEMQVVEAHLSYMSMPKGLRKRLMEQMERFRLVLDGRFDDAYKRIHLQGGPTLWAKDVTVPEDDAK